MAVRFGVIFITDNYIIDDLNHQDLLGQLKTQAFPLSDIITNAINQKEGVALDYALINDIKHNLLDNTFHLSLILICTYNR
ncbi:hypothetical protein BTM449_13140 [Helicobacter pylori]